MHLYNLQRTTPQRDSNIAPHLKIANTRGRMLGAFPCRLWPANQAEGAELAAARPWRLYCDLRCRGSARARPAPPSAERVPHRSAQPRLVQARLGVYNPFDTFLTRQFTVEYCALFDGLLPALDRLKLPLPLGGTSNHFRASALKWLMAWDPFNVTEDADLGIRLARNGYRCRMLASTTYEEAPSSLMSWLRQRTRWRQRLSPDLARAHARPPRAVAGAWPARLSRLSDHDRGHRVVGAGASLVLCSGRVSISLREALLALPESPLGWPFWLIACFDLSVGYLASMALGLLALRRRGYAQTAPRRFL